MYGTLARMKVSRENMDKLREWIDGQIEVYEP